MEQEFKKGDIVQLKSGGDKMTIDSFVWNPTTDKYETNRVNCVWFNSDNVLCKDKFGTESLEKIEE